MEMRRVAVRHSRLDRVYQGESPRIIGELSMQGRRPAEG
jgi:hypothetical protein